MSKDFANCSFLLTPGGTGAIGVIQVDGPGALQIANHCFQPTHGEPLATTDDGRIRFGQLLDNHKAIDDVLAVVMSQQGQWVVRLSCHGGIRVVERILAVLEKLGAPLDDTAMAIDAAWPADNELHRELIDALCHVRTERAARFYSWQMTNLGHTLVDLAARCEADPEAVAQALSGMVDRFGAARTLLTGADVAITGPPNVGKSTLFNRLIGRDAALVSPLAGTTRDWLREPLDFNGVPVNLVDTAGLGADGEDADLEAEASGVAAVESANLHLAVRDACSESIGKLFATLTELPLKSTTVLVINKIDLLSPTQRKALQEACNQSKQVVALSATTGEGLAGLTAAVTQALGVDRLGDQFLAFFTHRQQQATLSIVKILSVEPAKARELIRCGLVGD